MKKENKHTRTYRIKRIVIISLSALVLLMIYFFMDSSFTLRAVSFAAFLIIFYTIDHFFQIHFEAKHYAFMILIAITGLLFSPLYYIYPNYDKIQHFILPILVSSMVVHMISKLEIKFKWKLIFTLFITVFILTSFEIGEFALDKLFDLKLQGVYIRDLKGFEKFDILQQPLDDTMADISLGFVGSIIYLISYFFFYKEEPHKKIIK